MKSIKPLIIGNWKMNLNLAQAETLVRRLDMHIPKDNLANVVLCPNFTQLENIKNLIKSMSAESKFELGAQNLNNQDEGAFTGETSPLMLKGLVKYVVVGHSERRIHFGETDELVALKIAAALRHNLRPILCVGENLQERKDGLAKRKVLDQLEVGLSEATRQEIKKVIIAYEPVWAIGTGEFAKPYAVEEMVQKISWFVQDRFGLEADKIIILYGGSVDVDNSQSYLKIQNVGGLLVGGASLNYRAFSKIATS